MGMITCRRCGKTAEAIEPPFPTKRGQQIAAQACGECWTEWKTQSPLIVNHYGLKLFDPADREQLSRTQAEFLNLDAG